MKAAHMVIDRDYVLAQTDKKLFSSFVEPLDRCIYGGLYEPGHPSANEKGFRMDVLSLIRPLNLTMNRFPGGNYISTFRWEASKAMKLIDPEIKTVWAGSSSPDMPSFPDFDAEAMTACSARTWRRCPGM